MIIIICFARTLYIHRTAFTVHCTLTSRVQCKYYICHTYCTVSTVSTSRAAAHMHNFRSAIVGLDGRSPPFTPCIRILARYGTAPLVILVP